MAEELEYTSKYDGKTSDAIMDYSNKLRQQKEPFGSISQSF